jgi:hypothetical protein
MERFRTSRARRDGWTPERQLAFLAALARTRSVTKAAASVGMSRESAYRLRARDEGGLFALAWERAFTGGLWQGTRTQVDERHIAAIRRACGAGGANLRLTPSHVQLRDL